MTHLPPPRPIGKTEFIFVTSPTWNIVACSFGALVLGGIAWYLGIVMNVGVTTTILASLIWVLLFALYVIYVNKRELSLEEDFIRFKQGRKEVYLPYQNIRSYTIQRGYLWGSLLVNGGDMYARIHFWALGNYDVAMEVVKDQTEKRWQHR